MGYAITDNDIDTLAIACFNIQIKRAVVDFPTSTKAHPAYFAVVYGTPGPMPREEDKYVFPFRTPWHVWQRVVVPLLKDREYQIWEPDGTPVPQNQALMHLKDYDAFIHKIEHGLRVRFQEAGYLPGDPVAVGASQPAIPEQMDGEPIVIGGTLGGGESEYPDPDDSGSMFWPEGHPKLVYPIVDG